MAFNKEFVAHVMDLYGCNQLVVSRDGVVYALRPEGQFLVPGLVFDTDTADGTVATAAITTAATGSNSKRQG